MKRRKLLHVAIVSIITMMGYIFAMPWELTAQTIRNFFANMVKKMSADTIITIGELCFVAGIMFLGGMCVFLSQKWFVIALPLIICGLVIVGLGSNIDSNNIPAQKTLESETQICDKTYKFCPYCGMRIED